MKLCKSSRMVTLMAAGLLMGAAAGAFAQEDEHAKHHASQPNGSTPAQNTSPDAGTPSEMGRGMGGMMEKMGAPPPKELYPSLMELPDLPPERRAEVERLAHERMTLGVKLISSGLDQLTESSSNENYSAMQDATEQLRIGLAQFDSGLAAHRALAEGRAPRNVALEWFKKDMNLLPPAAAETTHGFFGLSWFHYFSMFVLATFAAVMIWMYFHKMRRAESLLASLKVTATRGISPVSVPSAAIPIVETPSPVAASPAGPAIGAYTIPAGRWSGQLRISKIFQETPDVKTFRLIHPSAGELPFTFEPGQFLTVSATIEGKEVRRSYSIASSSCRRTWCEITVKHAAQGVVSGYLHERVREGDLLAVTGPFGKFTFRGKEAPSVVLLAGGVGITPLMSAIRCLTDQAWTGEIFLIYACATMQDLIFREELEYLARRYPNLAVTLVLSKESSPAWKGERGYITKELLVKCIPNLNARRIHICGPPPMMDSVKSILAEINVRADQVKTENFLGSEPKPALAAAAGESSAAGPAAAVAHCSFVRSGKSAALPADRTVLEASEDVEVNIEYSCRQGYCGVCKTKLLAGKVTIRPFLT